MTSDRIIMVRTFRKAGTYKVWFKIKDNFGNENTYEKTVKVLEKYKQRTTRLILQPAMTVLPPDFALPV